MAKVDSLVVIVLFIRHLNADKRAIHRPTQLQILNPCGRSLGQFLRAGREGNPLVAKGFEDCFHDNMNCITFTGLALRHIFIPCKCTLVNAGGEEAKSAKPSQLNVQVCSRARTPLLQVLAKLPRTTIAPCPLSASAAVEANHRPL